MSYGAGKLAARTKLAGKGQVVIPQGVRERLGWRRGVSLRVKSRPDGNVLLEPEAGDPVEAACGCLKHGDPVGDLEAEHKAETRSVNPLGAARRPRYDCR